MHERSHLVELRVERFIRERLLPATIRFRSPVAVYAWEAPGEPVGFLEAAAAEYEPFSVGSAWGRPWGTTWFRLLGEQPKEWAGGPNTRIEVEIDLGFTAGQPGFQCEAMVWSRDGRPLRGIAPLNNSVVEPVSADGSIDVFIEAASNPDVGSLFTFDPTPLGDIATAGHEKQYVFRRADVVLKDLEVEELLADVLALSDLLPQLDPLSPRRAQILHNLDRMIDLIDPDDVAGSAMAARESIAPMLARPATASAHILHAVGHAHIDSAWLWPVRETVRKVARTFSNVLSLMDDDPTVTFASSSAQQFAWVKEHYPDLFERVRERVREGRFVPVGGMWVESDTNLPSGESLVRQFVAGKSFFLREFGIDTREVWLPDSFGYTAALPQIARLAGARWFLTQKISWNETNKVPHHTFLWEGLDGTRIFTHFPPVDKYNSTVSASDLAHAERNFADKGRATRSLLPYGYGDGGGGPTREMARRIARVASLEGSPATVNSTPAAFFSEAEKEYPNPEVWAGELYLEFHRGTYTSQLRAKQGNRRCEILLREAELWSTTAFVRKGLPYPAEELARLWETLLLQQFHDILPGTSIAWVHRDAERNYEALVGRLEAIIASSIRALVGHGDRVVSVNPAPHAREGVPAMGAAQVTLPSPVPAVTRRDSIVLDNGIVRAEFNVGGLLVSLIDKATGREAIPADRAGALFQLHRDTPTQWDAWDIDVHYRQSVTDLEAVAWTATDSAVTFEYSFGSSHAVVTVQLLEGARALEFDIALDWHERQKLLKFAFPLDIHTVRATSEIQFGHIERPIHTNTSWDAARFETVAHRWVRVAEPDFGVAIMNDSTYGHDVTREEREGGGTVTVVRLSLIRSAVFPDPKQDQGTHRLRVAIAPGADVQAAVQEGYNLNMPFRTVTDALETDIPPLIAVDNPGVVVEAVKLAEDGSGDVVVRLYEALGRRAKAMIDVDTISATVVETDLLERPLAPTSVVSVERSVRGVSRVGLVLRPFEIVTLRFSGS